MGTGASAPRALKCISMKNLVIIVSAVAFGVIAYALVIWLNLLGVVIAAVAFNFLCNISEDKGWI